jgi:2-oxoisovalerate dehydrogenase E1 component beta subunit
VQEYFVPIGEAKVCREGADLTVLSYSRMLPECVKAADALTHEGIHCEVIDLRTIYPVDMPTIRRSVAKTRRLLIVNEDTEVVNYGEHLIRRLGNEFFHDLEIPPKLLAGADVPGIGIAPVLEYASVPQYDDVVSAMRDAAIEPGRATAGEWPLIPETFFRGR